MVSRSQINDAVRFIGMVRLLIKHFGHSKLGWGGWLILCAPNFRLLVRLCCAVPCYAMRCFALLCCAWAVPSHSAPTE